MGGRSECATSVGVAVKLPSPNIDKQREFSGKKVSEPLPEIGLNKRLNRHSEINRRTSNPRVAGSNPAGRIENSAGGTLLRTKGPSHCDEAS
jgi:hypothetical protein